MGRLSPQYDASFDGVSFWEQGVFYPGRDVTTEGTLYSYGAGSHAYIDMGQGAPPFEIVAGVEATQAAALLTKRGVSGSLIWSRGSQTATLLDILPTEADAVNGNTYTLRFFSNSFPSNVVPANAIVTESGDPIVTESGDYIVME